MQAGVCPLHLRRPRPAGCTWVCSVRKKPNRSDPNSRQAAVSRTTTFPSACRRYSLRRKLPER